MARIHSFLRLAPCALVCVAATAGCSKPPEIPRGNDQIKPTYNERTGRLEKITYDRNRDGKVDAWTFMNGTRVVRAELDDNNDGTVDRWEFYDTTDNPGGAPSGTPAAGVLTRVEDSTRRDGKVSRWEYFEKGHRTRAEEDTDADGRVDKWETWADSALLTVLLDTDADGAPDRRLVYPADGSGPRFEIAGADGKFPAAP
jgi:hypothetical protein